jgi:hypothetical protein
MFAHAVAARPATKQITELLITFCGFVAPWVTLRRPTQCVRVALVKHAHYALFSSVHSREPGTNGATSPATSTPGSRLFLSDSPSIRSSALRGAVSSFKVRFFDFSHFSSVSGAAFFLVYAGEKREPKKKLFSVSIDFYTCTEGAMN